MTSHIGKIVSVAAGVPATFDKAGYEALTWVVVANPIVAPSPGWETSLIDVPNLTTGITKGDKGASVGRVSEMSFEEVAADPGQGPRGEPCALLRSGPPQGLHCPGL